MQTKDLDVVYILKDTEDNPELWYSLRSIAQNLAFKRVFFVGGKPTGLEPDFHLKTAQNGGSKWENAAANIKAACECENLSENFILCNDDFFIMKPVDSLPVYKNGTLEDHVKKVTKNYTENNSYITDRILPVIAALKAQGLPTDNFELHVPMVINKAKMLKVYEQFPNVPAKRSLYGNLYKLDGVQIADNMNDGKIMNTFAKINEARTFISTTDASFNAGEAGKQIRDIFKEPSRFEDFYYKCIYGR